MLKGDLRRATVSVRGWFVVARGRCASTPHSRWRATVRLRPLPRATGGCWSWCWCRTC